MAVRFAVIPSIPGLLPLTSALIPLCTGKHVLIDCFLRKFLGNEMILPVIVS